MKHLTRFQVAIVALWPFLIGATLQGDTVSSPYTQLSLSGVGYDSQPTEYLTISASTSDFSTSPSRAMEDNARKMERLREQLHALGVDVKDFRTADFRFGKARDPDDQSSDPRKGFSVEHRLSVVLREPKRAGAAMDALVNAGADNLSVSSGHGYSADVNPDSLHRARESAVRDAQSKAGDYAKALGMRIRRIISIQDGSGYVSGRPMPAAMAPMARVDIPTQIDSPASTVQASVGVLFELEK